MPEDIGEKTEQATPRRRQEARERGNVPRSTDLSSAIVLLGGLVVLRLTGGYAVRILFDFVQAALLNLHHMEISKGDIYSYFGLGGVTLIKSLLPFVGGLVAVAYVGNVIQTGFIFSGQPLHFRPDRINPVEGLRRLVSKRGLVRLMASIFKIIVIGLVAFYTIRSQFPTYLRLVESDHRQIGMFILGAAFEVGFKIAIALIILAILDFLFQRWQYEQDIRMTKQEVRDELRRMEGDPLTRDRRRRMQKQVATQRMMHDVPKADVVVTNPTELAIAIRYDPDEMDAPKVVAKGAGFIAERIRRIAQENDIPVIERKPLARALFRACEVGQQIPVQFYQAVAEVLAFVYELGKLQHVRPTPA